MIKSQKVRSLAATTLVAGAACVGAGCASIPKNAPIAPTECPPGAQEAMKRFGIKPPLKHKIFIPPYYPFQVPYRSNAIVSEGDVTAGMFGQFEQLPEATLLHGKLIFRNNRVYGHFSRAELPNGEFLPICMELISSYDETIGLPMEPGSTRKKTLVRTPMDIDVTVRFD